MDQELKPIKLEMTKAQGAMLFGLLKLTFEMQTEGKFSMSDQGLLTVMPIWENLAAQIDVLNGIR